MKNPAAFPVTTGSDGGCLNEGMTLRDYFAAKAMQALLSNSDAAMQFEKGDTTPSESRLNLSLIAYLISDSMLKARENPNENQTPKN